MLNKINKIEWMDGWLRIFTSLGQIYVHSQLYLASSLNLNSVSFILFGHMKMQVWFVRFSRFSQLLDVQLSAWLSLKLNIMRFYEKKILDLCLPLFIQSIYRDKSSCLH